VIKAVAAAALIGGGSMVLHNATNIAVQAQLISEHDHRIAAVERLGDKLDDVNKNVIILNERLKSPPYPEAR